MRDYGTEFDDRRGRGNIGLILVGAIGMIAIILTAATMMASVSTTPDQARAAAPTINPSIHPTIQPTIQPTAKPTVTPKPTPEPKTFDARRYGAPGNMVEDPKYKGVYLGNLGGLVAFIDIEVYLHNGGACKTGNMNGVPLYTRFGLDPQSLYDPNTGIVWSLIEDPWTLELYNEKRGALGYA